ncbi:MAG TPA: hypothetical protein VK907_05315, partial [Phnomibacter sp.]|nr:hypothetical protein [Phnomibacter sp.]
MPSDPPTVITPMANDCPTVVHQNVEVRLEEFAEMPEIREDFVMAVAGSRVIIAGGRTDGFSGRVDIYDTQTRQWETFRMPNPRYRPIIVASGNRVFFAGGWDVDVLDLSTKEWHLIQVTSHVYAGVASTNKVVFLSGNKYIDIFEMTPDAWNRKTSKHLRHPRSFGHSVALVDDKLFIAGGITSNSAGTGGGEKGSDIMEIHDLNSGRISEIRLPNARVDAGVAIVRGKIVMAGG